MTKASTAAAKHQPPLTVARLERRLRGLVLSERVEWRIRKLDGLHGLCWFTKPRPKVTVDPMAPKLDTVIHELIHIELRAELAWWGEFYENVTCTVEDIVVRHINSSRSRREWWRRTIAATLEEDA